MDEDEAEGEEDGGKAELDEDAKINAEYGLDNYDDGNLL